MWNLTSRKKIRGTSRSAVSSNPYPRSADNAAAAVPCPVIFFVGISQGRASNK
jgi:hypothetical protein